MADDEKPKKVTSIARFQCAHCGAFSTKGGASDGCWVAPTGKHDFQKVEEE